MNKYIPIAVVVLVAFAFGRFSAPEKIKIEKEISTVTTDNKQEKKDVNSDAERDKHIEKTTTEVVRPDGTKETTTRVTEDSSTKKRVDSTTNSTEEINTASHEKATETREARSGLSVSVFSGVSISGGPLVYGALAQRNFIGPIALGVWGMSNGTAGLSVGLTF